MALGLKIRKTIMYITVAEIDNLFLFPEIS